VSVLIHNPSPSDVGLLARIDWYDASGRPIPTAIQGPTRISVPREGEIALEHYNANPDSADFRIVLDGNSTSQQVAVPSR
jgi:uncharacterized protein YcfL